MASKKMKNYKELHIWTKGIEIVKLTYKISETISSNEKFGLISQMTRAAVSIPSNVAEGNSRKSDKDKARFIEIALGSAFELQTHLVVIQEIYNAKTMELKELNQVLEEEIKMLHTFYKTLTVANS